MRKDEVDRLIEKKIGKGNLKWFLLLFISICIVINFLVTNILPRWIAYLEIQELIRVHQNSTSFTFTDSELSTLPDSLYNLKDLEELYLYRNKLSHVPDGINQFTELRVLHLGSNDMERVPPQILRLTGLEELWIHSNAIDEVPREIGQLAHLEILDLSYNKIQTLPEEIAQLTNLRILKLNGNCDLKAIPQGLFLLEEISLIDLSGTQIKEGELPFEPEDLGMEIRIVDDPSFCN